LIKVIMAEDIYDKLGFSDEICPFCKIRKWQDPKDGYKICLNACSLVAMRKKRLENEL